MKIPLLIRERFGQKMPFIFISIKAPQYRVRPVVLRALMDTGSPWTAITPLGSSILKVPISALPQPKEWLNIGFAAYKFQRVLMENVQVHVVDESKKVTTIDMPSVTVLKSTKQIDPNEFKDVPAVVGCDFLMLGKFSLRFDPSSDNAFLEQNE